MHHTRQRVRRTLMKLVIDIDDEDYKRIKDIPNVFNSLTSRAYSAIRKGTPLPKGHGRIMDVDKVIKKMEEREEQLKDDRSIWETAGVETALDMFGEAIIEAESEE